MRNFLSVAGVGIALAAMGCEQQAQRPPETAQAVARPTPPPGSRPDAPPGPLPHAGGPWAPHHGGDARHAGGPGPDHPPPDHPREHRARRHRGQGKMGRMGPGHMGPGAGGHDMMRELRMLGVHVYPPPLVMRRAKESGLTPDQVTKIRDEMLATRKRSIDLHSKIEHTKIEIARLLAADKPDEKAINAQFDDAAKAHAEMHKLHVGMLLRVRALLSAEQRQKLDEPKPHPRPGMGPTSQVDDGDDDDLDDGDGDDDAEG